MRLLRMEEHRKHEGVKTFEICCSLFSNKRPENQNIATHTRGAGVDTGVLAERDYRRDLVTYIGIGSNQKSSVISLRRPNKICKAPQKHIEDH